MKTNTGATRERKSPINLGVQPMFATDQVKVSPAHIKSVKRIRVGATVSDYGVDKVANQPGTTIVLQDGSVLQTVNDFDFIKSTVKLLKEMTAGDSDA